MYQVSRTGAPRAVYSPAVDIHESDVGLTLVADLPGAAAEQIDVSIEHNVLSICAPVEPVVPAGARFLYREQAAGDYVRSFILGDDLDTCALAAEFRDGVLTIRLPKLPFVGCFHEPDSNQADTGA